MAIGILHGQVKQSKVSLVNRDERSLVSFLSKYGYVHNKTIPVKTVAILVDAGGAFENVSILCAPSTDPRPFAEMLNERFGPHGVVWFSEAQDYATAQYRQSEAKPFSDYSVETLDLEPIKSRLESEGYRVVGAIRTTQFSTVTPTSFEATDKTMAGNYFDLVGTTPLPLLSVSCRLQPWTILVLLTVFVFTPVGVCSGLVAATIRAKNTAISKSIRLAHFTKIIRFAVLLPLGVGTIFSFWAIFSHQMTPLCDLWFGDRTSGPMAPLTMLPLLIVTPCALWVSKIETRLKSDKDVDSDDFKPVRQTFASHVNKAAMRTQFGLMIFFFGGNAFCISLPSEEYGQAPRFIGTLFMFLGLFSGHLVTPFFKLNNATVPVLTPYSLVDSEEEVVLDENVKRKAIDYAEKKKVNLVNVIITDPGDTKPALAPSFMYGSLSISRRTIQDLTPRELDFALAYVLDSMLPMMAPLFGLCIGLSMVCMPIMFKFQGLYPKLVLLTPVAMFPIMLVTMPYLMRGANAGKVRRALAIVPDVEAAESYLAKARAQGRNKTLFGGKIADPWEDYKRYCLNLK